MRNCPRWETSTSEVVFEVCTRAVEKAWTRKSMDCCIERTLGNVCLVWESAAFGLRSELEEWTVSAANERLVGGDEKSKIKFSIGLPDRSCVVCKKDIFSTVLQGEHQQEWARVGACLPR